mmetsp:Transcript_34581/g.86278  ORF Transcript_34581/g.86278 Transcript_34581/m.86278 type:complete len:215 (-) Transcript_34581:1357-2001(-)
MPVRIVRNSRVNPSTSVVSHCVRLAGRHTSLRLARRPCQHFVEERRSVRRGTLGHRRRLPHGLRAGEGLAGGIAGAGEARARVTVTRKDVRLCAGSGHPATAKPAAALSLLQLAQRQAAAEPAKPAERLEAHRRSDRGRALQRRVAGRPAARPERCGELTCGGRREARKRVLARERRSAIAERHGMLPVQRRRGFSARRGGADGENYFLQNNFV